MHRLHERAANRLLRHDDASWMELVHQLVACTGDPASGCPVVVMVQPIHDRTSYDLVPCILSSRKLSEPFRNLLRNALMRSCLVEVPPIGIEHALELPIVEDEEMVQALLSDAPQIAFTDRISSGSVIGRFKNLAATGPRHPLETGSKLAVVIPNEILGGTCP